MTQTQRVLRRIFVFVALLLVSGFATLAQDTITILCNPAEPQTEHPLLPGTYFHMTEAPYNTKANANYRFEAISASGTRQYIVPFPPEISDELYDPSISPDGRFMIFRSDSSDIGLLIWDLQTNEVSSLPLQPSDLKYLNPSTFAVSIERERNMLTWLDIRHLLLQYYDDAGNRFNHRINGQKRFTIVESPLSLIEEAEEVFAYPDLPTPEGNIYSGVQYSPDHRYATQISYQSIYGHEEIFLRLQIYDIQSSPNLVYDAIPTAEAYPSDLPVWMPDGKTAFILFRNSDYHVRRILELHANEAFKEDWHLQEALNNAIGTDVLPGGFDPVVSPSGKHILFSAYVPTTETVYFVRYTPSTRQITAVCDTHYAASGQSLLFWVPGERYFAYSTGNPVFIFDLETGAEYSLPGQNDFIGWIEQDIYAPQLLVRFTEDTNGGTPRPHTATHIPAFRHPSSPTSDGRLRR